MAENETDAERRRQFFQPPLSFEEPIIVPKTPRQILSELEYDFPQTSPNEIRLAVEYIDKAISQQDFESVLISTRLSEGILYLARRIHTQQTSVSNTNADDAKETSQDEAKEDEKAPENTANSCSSRLCAFYFIKLPCALFKILESRPRYVHNLLQSLELSNSARQDSQIVQEQTQSVELDQSGFEEVYGEEDPDDFLYEDIYPSPPEPTQAHDSPVQKPSTQEISEIEALAIAKNKLLQMMTTINSDDVLYKMWMEDEIHAAIFDAMEMLSCQSDGRPYVMFYAFLLRDFLLIHSEQLAGNLERLLAFFKVPTDIFEWKLNEKESNENLAVQLSILSSLCASVVKLTKIAQSALDKSVSDRFDIILQRAEYLSDESNFMRGQESSINELQAITAILELYIKAPNRGQKLVSTGLISNILTIWIGTLQAIDIPWARDCLLLLALKSQDVANFLSQISSFLSFIVPAENNQVYTLYPIESVAWTFMIAEATKDKALFELAANRSIGILARGKEAELHGLLLRLQDISRNRPKLDSNIFQQSQPMGNFLSKLESHVKSKLFGKQTDEQDDSVSQRHHQMLKIVKQLRPEARKTD